jgi:hypothetical protein
MWTDKQIGAAAAAAAEKANGGKFSDPLFYKPEHKAFWQEVVQAALVAAAPSQKPKTEPVTAKEVEDFSSHCSYVRSVYKVGLRIWRDSTEVERKAMEATARGLFGNFGQVFGEFLVLAASRITDPARDARNNQSLTLELFQNHFAEGSEARTKLDPLYARIMTFRAKFKHVRHKLIAHADRAVIAEGKALLSGTWPEWDDFWVVLRDYIRIVSEAITGKPYDIDESNATEDAAALLKAIMPE